MDGYYIATLDTSNPNPIFGRVDDQDQEKDIFLVAIYTLPKTYQYHRLFTADDLGAFAIFKGKEEAVAWVQANFT